MTSKITIPHLKHTKVYVARADRYLPGAGLGLFAKKNLKRDETIFLVKGKKINFHVTNKTESATLPNAIGYEPDVWLDPYSSNPLPYLNHSCEPNAGIKGKVTVKALKNIKKGEHITIDYSITECDRLWTLPGRCHCGAKNCRKIIGPIQSLPLSTYKKYLPYIPRVMQKEYRAMHTL